MTNCGQVERDKIAGSIRTSPSAMVHRKQSAGKRQERAERENYEKKIVRQPVKRKELPGLPGSAL